ncbi:lytic murein transglycosylase [Rhodobacter aestuarii]|uniref:Lytic murein transglycosylase n=2 Tax=Rhodobacter aestuarii TaxID=453582 RepID=A0A1N7LRP5_9RHOB|nr:lytic murein transglycosylase [Rhodobacter aestuarii]PTV95073.1 lytic murein transglycosylase [Rhodobacter aestuarii]SIS76506.1 lytic murein transglycosylase [Rhodobacter aestuarii]
MRSILSASFMTAMCLSVSLPVTAQAQCGGNFSSFVAGLKAEAQRHGLSAAQADAFFKGVRQDSRVLKADRAQGVFRMSFLDFANRVISQNRLTNGARMAQKYDAIFDRAERDYGVSRGVLLAFWALETDFGQVQGDFNTRDALVTLAHDCRRPQLFRPQVIAAAELFKRGDFDPARTIGAWAGEVGQVQMLPDDILRNGVDGDGDGHVDLKGSSADALMSGARMIAGMGWRRGEPWLQEIAVPAEMDWSKTGLNRSLSTAEWARMGVKPRSGAFAGGQGSVLLPMGRKGPAFIAYPNFKVLFEWNKSFVYVTTAAYFATRLEGAPRVDPQSPEPGLSVAQMKALQQKLQAQGFDVGPIDGILGEKTREAVQRVQKRLGLPADAWPTPALLQRL